MATNNNIPSNRHLQKSQNIFKNWLQAAIKNVLVAEIQNRLYIYHVDVGIYVKNVLLQRKSVRAYMIIVHSILNEVNYIQIIKFDMNKQLRTLTFLLFFFSQCNTFLVQMSLTDKKCFLMTVFPHQNLLLEIEMPMIKQKISIKVIVNSKQDKIFQKNVTKSLDRITIDMNNSPKPSKIQQIQVCIDTKQQSVSRISQIHRKYLFWISHISNFKHQIKESKPNKSPSTNKKITENKTKQQYMKQVFLRTDRMIQLYEGQLQLYEKYQNRQKKNDQDIQNLQTKLYVINIIEMVSVLGFTTVYLLIIKRIL